MLAALSKKFRNRFGAKGIPDRVKIREKSIDKVPELNLVRTFQEPLIQGLVFQSNIYDLNGYRTVCHVNNWEFNGTMRCSTNSTTTVITYTQTLANTTAWAYWAGRPVPVRQTGIVADQFERGVPTLLRHADPETDRAYQAQLQQQREADAVRMAELATKNKDLQEAINRANKLLLMFLTPAQRASLKERDFFEIRSQLGNVYRIQRGQHGNVFLVENGKMAESLCFQPTGAVPDGDAMLVQKFMLESDELGVRKVANVRNLREFRPQVPDNRRVA